MSKQGQDQNNLPINEQIQHETVRLITQEGQQIGIVTLSEALSHADSANLDLVMINRDAKPPVCKLLNYGKYKYQLEKKTHLARKKQKQILVKEIKLRPSTDTHDIEYRKKHAIQFLEEGNKVKVSVVFKGRELSHKEFGLTMIKKFYEGLDSYGSMEKDPTIEGRAVTITIAPKSKLETKA